MSTQNDSIKDTKEFLDSLIDDLLVNAKFIEEETTIIMPSQSELAPSIEQDISYCGKVVSFFGCQKNDNMEKEATGNSLLKLDGSLIYSDFSRIPLEDWLIDAIGNENSEEDVVIFERKPKLVVLNHDHKECQTNSLKLKRLTFDETKQLELGTAPPSPCEMTKQTVLIEALSYPTPSMLSRAPLMDRFCYMLTDFASALYLSIAIMCCCTPSMFVRR